MPALRLDLGGEAEIVVPTDEFKSSAQFDEAQKLLREEDLRRDPSFHDYVLPVIVDGEGQPLIVDLRNRVEDLSAIAGMNPYTASLPDPASLVVVEDTKPDKAVQQVETARSEQVGDTVEVIEELSVRSDIERPQQHIGQVKRVEPAIGIAPSVPFLQIRSGSGSELEDPMNFRLREFGDHCLEKIEFASGIVGG